MMTPAEPPDDPLLDAAADLAAALASGNPPDRLPDFAALDPADQARWQELAGCVLLLAAHAEAATATDLPPEVSAAVPGLAVECELGRGGMGVVYRAKDRRLGHHVAIKVLPAALEADQGRLTRFEREARLLATLNHPHIAAIEMRFSAASALKRPPRPCASPPTRSSATGGLRSYGCSRESRTVPGNRAASDIDMAEQAISAMDKRPLIV